MIKHLKIWISMTALSSWILDMTMISLFMMWKRSGHPYDLFMNSILFIISILLNITAGFLCTRLMTHNKSSGLKAIMASAYVFTFKTATIAILVVAKFSD